MRALFRWGIAAAMLSSTLRAEAQAADCWARPPQASSSDTARRRRALAPRRDIAVRLAGAAPRIDGHLDDAAWCAAPPAGDFIQTGPSPGQLASLPTVARVLYDDAAIYVAIRAFDPHPERILAPYLRRDDENNSDWLFVEIDSRFDHRSGFSLGVNPRGIQADGSWSDDVNYDGAWNGIWASAAQVDSLGWTVEYRIPFSQLALGRGGAGDSLVFGVNFYRSTPHAGESSNWSPRLPSVVGVVSHFNELHGLTVPPRHAGLEVAPYSSFTAAHGTTTGAVGGDLQFRPSPTATVALSLRPDFGQVEADPSQINLTTFETYLPEQRPLFVNDASVFQFLSPLNYSSRGTSFAQESPFYSRRVGAPPHGVCPAVAHDCSVPTSTTLLGAARLSGRSASGWSGGLFQAWTEPEQTAFSDASGQPGAALAEPGTSFTVARGMHESHGGSSAIGAMATFVDRTGLRDGLDSLLPAHALVTGIDGRTRLGRDRYEVSGFALASRVDGSAPAIAALRDAPRHGYNRPDSLGGSTPGLDSAQTTLSGVTAQARIARIDGRLQWGVASRFVSRGFEANDAGFQRNADWLLAEGFWNYQVYRPGHTIRVWSVGSTQIGSGWTTAGLRRSTVANLSGSMGFRNYFGGTLSLNQEFAAFDPELLRGGPALLLPPETHWALTAHSDSRRRWLATVALTGSRASATGSSAWGVSPDFTAFLSDRLQVELNPAFDRSRQGWQYVAQPRDAGGRAHYLLAAVTERDASLTLRATYAFSRALSLQLYAQPFVAGGAYADYLEVVSPAAAAPAARVTPLANALQFDTASQRFTAHTGALDQFAFDNPAFSERDFHLNALLRWEFRPGSTLFVVWTQQRSASDLSDFALAGDLRRLWRAPVVNALQVKVSYWIGV